MRRLALLVLVLVAACSTNSGGSGSDDTTSQCTAIRHAIERDKVAVRDAQVAGDTPGAAKARVEVDGDARAARSITGCDISDLVGADVGQ